MNKRAITVLALVSFFSASCAHNDSRRSDTQKPVEFGQAPDRDAAPVSVRRRHDRDKKVEPRSADKKVELSSAKTDLVRDYDDAIARYTEDIRLNPQDEFAFHNRGRLRFYKGEFALSAADLATALQLNPTSRYAAIWLYLARVRSNPKHAKPELILNAENLKAADWPAPVLALYLDRAAPETVTANAADPNPKTQNEQLCEAAFYLGEWHLLKGDKVRARVLLQEAKDKCPDDSVESDGAVAELQRLK